MCQIWRNSQLNKKKCACFFRRPTNKIISNDLRLSVIIINYNVKFFLEQCLLSVIKAMKNIEGEIIVVDNNSTEGSRAFFKDKFKCVRFLWSECNMGFGKANNLALVSARGEYILFLNPDTIVPEDCFEKCISYIQSHDDNCALGIKMIDGAGNFLKESKRAFPSPLTSLYKLSGLSSIFPRSKTFAKYHLGNLSENENHEVDVLAGAFMMIPKKILEIVKGFDEDFFMYGEDIDLSFRIQEAGFKNVYFTGSPIIHFKGESTRKGSLNYVKMFYKAMSVFVKKHYQSTAAKLFYFTIQAAILFRAALASIARFLKWIGLPAIDAAVILISFWGVKFLWSEFIKQQVNYSPNLLLIAFPVFTFLFLGASFLAGLYDNGYKQSRLNRSTLFAILVILSIYSLLPENLRFSRGILLFGSLWAFALMTVMRKLLLKAKIIESAANVDETNQTIIASTAEEFSDIACLLKKQGKAERILGRIETGDSKDSSSIGMFKDLSRLVHLYPVTEIVYCEGALSFKQIIEDIPHIPQKISIKIFAKGSHALIGSDDKDSAADFSSSKDFHLDLAVYKRSKHLFDIGCSLVFLLTFPIHFFIKRKPLVFFRNIFSVLIRRKTWVGYCLREDSLPLIQPGIITTTGFPIHLNTLPEESLLATDKLYARHYEVVHDIQLVLNNYRFLS